MEAITQCEWIGASRGQIDELKETQAAVLRLKHNLSTYEQERARLGGDWRSDLRQIAREKALFEEYDIAHPNNVTDNAMNAASGEKNVGEVAEEGANEGDKDAE